MFLLILIRPDYLGNNVPNLHSTMFLLILMPVCCSAPCSRIYIPLCFYLYRSRSLRRISFPHSFTFHYVSTYTSDNDSDRRTYRHLHSTMFLLILIRKHMNDGWIPDLHSTMFLLILEAKAPMRKSSRIYIPLCFYLY